MIVTPIDGRLRVVTQPDHAHLAADLLRLVRRPELVEHPRRETLLVAVRSHDDGWQGPDAAPRVDPASGRPFDFRSLPPPERVRVYDDVSTRHRDRPYVAALLTRHVRGFLADRRDDPHWSDLVGRLDERWEAWCEAAELAPELVDDDYGWLRLADTLSLALCERWKEPFPTSVGRARIEQDTLHLDPFPFAGTTRFALACRWIPDRAYRSDADLALELATARWERATVRVAPD